MLEIILAETQKTTEEATKIKVDVESNVESNDSSTFILSKSTASNNNTTTSTDSLTFSLLYPLSLIGGYRNQAMRFIGFLRLAAREGSKMDTSKSIDHLLLPTLVFGTRYKADEHNLSDFNPVVTFWPVPFDELFDVDHWNSFHLPKAGRSIDGASRFTSLPLLVTSVGDDIDINVTNEGGVCWKPTVDQDIISIPAVQANAKYNATFSKSFLPLLTYRMLFHSHNDRPNFMLAPLQTAVVGYLLGNKIGKKQHKINFRSCITNCTHPYVYGGSSMDLWYEYLKMNNRAPAVLPGIDPLENYIANVTLVEETTPVEEQKQSSRSRKRLHRKLQGKNKNMKHPKNDLAAQYDTRLVKTVYEALIPAKPWRQLADLCVEHHISMNEDEFQQQQTYSHKPGHNHGYIALHARIEPEMLFFHKCGQHMEQNLTTILDLTQLLSLDYNGILPAAKAAAMNYTSPIDNQLREKLQKRRKLKANFIAVGRDGMKDFERGTAKLKAIARYNWDTLNHRSISYDDAANELFTSSLLKKEQKTQQHQKNSPETFTNNNPSNLTSSSLPIFECGEGWVEHAFYSNEMRQRKLFKPSLKQDETKPYGLYNRYGFHGDGSNMDDHIPILPLPKNYFGDILPSLMSFWLAVNADVFVGAMKSSWSNDVWTVRYFQGKGDRNFQYTRDRGIIPVMNNGLPPPHGC